jgi:hypothetical protein
MYKSMTIKGPTVRLVFRFANGLSAKSGQQLTGFEIAGSDNKWSFATATIHNDTVVVSNSAVSSPTQVRYAWADDPPCNLMNSAGLPASPFQTSGSQLPVSVKSRSGSIAILPYHAQGKDLTFNALGKVYKIAKPRPGEIMFISRKGIVRGIY